MPKLKLDAKTLTLRQGVLIAVLGAVLIGAICWPAGDSASVDAGARQGSPAAIAARRAAQQATAVEKVKKWPQVELDAALRHDPFSSPLLTAQAAPDDGTDDKATPEAPSADLLALRQDGVSMIVRDGAGMVATVGERKLRVGDVIGGYRVAAIEMDGVVLERVTSNGNDE